MKVTRALDFLFPNFECLGCRGELRTKDKDLICAKCREKIIINDGKTTLRNIYGKQYFTQVFAPFKYAEPINNIMIGLKYASIGDATKFIAPYMAQCLDIPLDNAILVPIPLHKKREVIRGYNQAKLLADNVGKILGVPVMDGVIERIKNTTAQKQMTTKERGINLRDAFNVIDKDKIWNKIVVLVDDVYTSGSTVNECSRMCLRSGAQKVYVLCGAIA